MKNVLLTIAFLMLAAGSISFADYANDTVWTNKTDQVQGFYMVKFSNTDSLIVGHGYEMDLFFDAKTGQEIKRIPFNAEVYFINNDLNFIRLAPSRNKLEIFDTHSFQVIDSLEHDNLAIGSVVITKDERYAAAIITGGFRIWDLTSKKIIRTKIYPHLQETDFLGWDFGRIYLNCDDSKLILEEIKKYKNPNPKDPNPIEKKKIIIYEFNTLDSVGELQSKIYYELSNTCKYIAYATGDPDYGVELYDFNTKQLLHKFNINGPSLTGLEFSPDDKFLVTANGPGANSLTIWNIETGKVNYNYAYGGYSNIDVSHDGKYIISSIGGYLFLWYSHFGDVSIPEGVKDKIPMIYPNPTNKEAIIQFDMQFSEVTLINITDLKGVPIKIVYNDFLDPGNKKIQFSTSDLASGIYLVKVQNTHLSLTFKLIVSK